MPTDFARLPNLVSARIGTAGYTAGSGTLTLRAGDGAKFPTLTSGQWLRLTVIRRAVAYSPLATAADWSILKVTGRTGDVLTIVSTLEGTTDRDYASGDVVECRWTGGHGTAIQDAVNTLEVTTAEHSASIATNAADISTLQDDVDAIEADATIVRTTGSYANPGWITSLAGSKVSGNIGGNAASITGSITTSQVTGLADALMAKANDNAVVHSTGSQAETIDGNKSFSGNTAFGGIVDATEDVEVEGNILQGDRNSGVPSYPWHGLIDTSIGTYFQGSGTDGFFAVNGHYDATTSTWTRNNPFFGAMVFRLRASSVGNGLMDVFQIPPGGGVYDFTLPATPSLTLDANGKVYTGGSPGTITGSKGGNAAVASIVAFLVAQFGAVDSTS